ncbi:MAG: MFS transporter [Burkholderiales bacterium]|nr:MFS transporter [Burkholderiales bacterium]
MPLRHFFKSDPARAALAVLALCLTLNLLGRGVADTYVVFLLPLEQDLGWSRSQMTSVYSVYLLANGLTAPLAGMLFDRLGPRAVYGSGLAGLGVAYLLAARIDTLWQFYATIGVMSGFAVAALGMVPSSSILARWFRERLSSAMSIAFAGMGLGALLIVPATQYLLTRLGWRDAYWVLGIVLLALLPLVLALPWRAITAGHPDYRGPRRRAAGGESDWTLRRAVGSLNFWALAWIFCLTSVGMFSVTVQTVIYLVEQGFSPILAAAVYGSTAMLSVFGIVVTGLLADRYGPRRTVSATYAGSIAGIVVLLVISWQPRAEWLVAYVVAFGLCQGARGPIISSMTTRLFAGSQVATIYGVIYASNAFGAGLGALLGGVIHDLTGSYRPGFVFAIGCLIAAGLPFWRVPALRDFRTRG